MPKARSIQTPDGKYQAAPLRLRDEVLGVVVVLAGLGLAAGAIQNAVSNWIDEHPDDPPSNEQPYDGPINVPPGYYDGCCDPPDSYYYP